MVMAVRWPLCALLSKKFQVNLTVHRLEGFSPAQIPSDDSKVILAVKWKGPARAIGTSFRRKMKTDQSSEANIEQGSISLEEEFENVCTLLLSKDVVFQPWHVLLLIRKVTTNQPKHKWPALGKAVVDLSKFAPPSGDASQVAKIPLENHSGYGISSTLSVSLNFVELFTKENGSEGLHWIVVPTFCIGVKWDKDDADEIHMLKRINKGGVNGCPLAESSKNFVEDLTSEEKLFPISDESYYASGDTFESDCLEEQDDNDQHIEDPVIKNFLAYGTIAGTNLVYGKNFSYDPDGVEGEDEFREILSLYQSPISIPKLVDETSSSDSDQTAAQSSMKSLLSWRKRKLSFRPLRAKGEPLLHKSYGEDGGDEIDWDRRQRHSEPLEVVNVADVESGAFISDKACDFGESFRVGEWEQREILSRDGRMKLCTQVFFASIDQRSESAAGESACTALVAVIADWLHHHPNIIPSRTEFNALIRDGSAEWRKLCEDESYKDSFPDRHFDLETIVQAAVRPLSMISEKSYVGFFQTDGLGDSGEFLQGSMSFDSIWNEISLAGPAVYAVSWNDHFFILKVEDSGCFIIDTLGERLYEGCNQAYILKFDEKTSLCHLSPKDQQKLVEEKKSSSSTQTDSVSVDEKHDVRNYQPMPSAISARKQMEATISETGNAGDTSIPQEQAAYVARDACREFVKGFFAALPLRELQADVKKGLKEKDYIFRRLQIEFHFTSLRLDSRLADL